MQFIYADGTGQSPGQTVLAATAPGQVLGAAAGVNVLADAGGFGVTFQGTLAGLAQELISGFSAKDLIDIVGLDSAAVSMSFAGSGTAGVLQVTGAAGSGELYLAGALGGGSFQATADGHGGTLIRLG
jgi:hypothetical protein